MNAVNYDKMMEEIIASHKDDRPSLLLHACCAPCSSACLERLKDHFKITAFFYNPNIEDDEYSKRKNELLRLLDMTGWADVLDCENDPAAFYYAIKGYEKDDEGGSRCEKCFALRLERTAEAALMHDFEYFATTLTISPLKNAALINSIGEELAAKFGVKWLYSDFKKQDGYLRSLQLSKQYDLYRQNYCGCIYSRMQAQKS